jgi:hypothetical protein
MNRKILITSGVLAVLALGGGAAFAQRGHGPGMMGPGMMMGDRLCNAKEPLAPRLIDRMSKTLQPTDAQKADFDALASAVTKAEGDLKAACPTDAERADQTPPGRLNLAEKRMSAGLAALRTVKDPFNALYAKLDDKQRDRIRWSGHGWGGGHEGGPMGWWHGGDRPRGGADNHR